MEAFPVSIGTLNKEKKKKVYKWERILSINLMPKDDNERLILWNPETEIIESAKSHNDHWHTSGGGNMSDDEFVRTYTAYMYIDEPPKDMQQRKINADFEIN